MEANRATAAVMLSAAIPVTLLGAVSFAVTVQLAPAPEDCATAMPVVVPIVAALAGIQEIDQVTGPDRGCVEPSLKPSFAVNATVWPTAIVAVKGVTSSFTTVGGGAPTVK